MTDELFNHIIKRLMSKADDAVEKAKQHPDDKFWMGFKCAQYIVLDTIRNDLIIADYDLKECGLEEDPGKKYM